MDSHAEFKSRCIMITGRFRQSFTDAVRAEAGAFPREGLILVGGWALASAAASLIYWSHRQSFTQADVVLAAAMALSCGATSFYSATRMVEVRMSWGVALRFFGTGAALFVPIVLALGALLLAAKLKVHVNPWALILLFIASISPLVFLPGWPVWQAASSRLVGPMEAFRATKGFRLALLVANSVIGSVNRMTPDLSSARDLPTAGAIAVGGALLDCILLILGLSIAVAAYRRMAAAGAR